jgi:NAD(P)-dependent dehydrogenase (short-subunit alcohol dehydrogenase family)
MSSSKVAVITGAGSGIGKCVAVTLANNGYTVVFAGRRREALEAASREITDQSIPYLVAPTDVTDPQSVEALFAQVKEHFGRVDLLFNNAGAFSAPALLEDIAYEDWKTVVDVNLTGVFLCTQAAFRLMKTQRPRGGRIINNGSISAYSPRPNSIAYTATKHAVTGMTKATSLDGRKYDIACGQIDIGNALTDRTQRMENGVPQANGTMAPEPTMDPLHVANAVLYMAGLPLEANVQFMTVMATKMPFVGRG